MPRPIHLIAAAAVALIALAAWLAYDWQPDRQLRKATERVLTAVEKRDWETLRNALAEDYRDEWDLDRSQLIQLTSEAMQQFFFLSLEPSAWQITRDANQATVACQLTVTGNGTGLAQIALNRLQEADEPFRFEWRKESWKPWDWRLYSAAQPELRFSRDSIFQ